jgi:thiol-disulfide isomerase/thioredoxin
LPFVAVAAALLIARLVLAALFLVAGGAKLADRDGSRAAVAGFGLKRFIAVVAVLLPLAELLATALLLPSGTARWGGLLALVLLVAFGVAIASALRRGEAPDCHCFGQLQSAPAGRVTLARNAVLAVLSGFVVVAGWQDGGASPVRWLADLSPAGVVALAAGLVIALLVGVGSALFVTLLRQHGRLLLRVEELEGALSHELPMPEASGGLVFPDLEGRPVDLGALHGRRTLLLFWNPDCGYCQSILSEVRRADSALDAGVAQMILVSTGAPRANRALGLRSCVLSDPDFVAAPAFGASGTPSAILLDESGEVASDLAAGADEVIELLHAYAHTAPGVSA